MQDFIKLENVVFKYPVDEDSVSRRRGYAAVNGVSLSIEKGSFTAILGHNGSGKSTLAKLMSGVLLPSKGKVFVDGIDTSDESKNFDIRKKVGMVFQNPDNQIVANVVEEDVAFAPENLGLQPEEIRKRVDSALEKVGMSEYAKHAPHLLSGGQKQRVAIAGIIAMMPECIIFDESTAMLDPSGRRDILDTILKLNREMGITVILITHYMNEAIEADRVVVMNDAEVVIDGSPRDVFSEIEKLWEIGLDVPEVTELMYLLSREEGFTSLPRGILSENEAVDLIEKVFRK